jgi:hypothetical protein
MTKKCDDLGGQLVHALPEKREAFAQITVDDSTSNLCQQVRGPRRPAHLLSFAHPMV